MEQLDLVSIATPTTLHAPIAVAALNAGMHVLCEKPMAENADKARLMVEAAERNDRVLDVSFNHRPPRPRPGPEEDHRRRHAGQDLLRQGRLVAPRRHPGLGSWFTRKATSGGGPLMDLGVHMLDIALYLLGEPPVRTATAATYAEFGPSGKGSSMSPLMHKTGVQHGAFDVEDLSTAFLRLEDGATLLLESSWAQWIPKDHCYVTMYGADGGASIEWGAPNDPHRTLSIWTEKSGVPATLHPSVPPDGLHTECVMDFVADVRSGDYTNHRGKQALARAVVIDACYASAEKGNEIILEH